MKPSVRYGLLYAGVLIGLSLLFYGLGMEKNTAVEKFNQWFGMIALLGVVFLAIKARRNETGEGYLTFGQGFGTGMMTTLIGTFIISLYTLVYMKFLNPGMMDYIKLRQEEEMVKRGMDEAQVEQAMSQMETFSSPEVMALFFFLGFIVLGLVISLIVTAFLKKDPPEVI